MLRPSLNRGPSPPPGVRVSHGGRDRRRWRHREVAGYTRDAQGVVKVFLELSNKNSARSGGFEIHDPTVTLKKESVQEIVGRNSANLDHGQVSECNSLDKVIALIVNNNASEGL